MAEYSISAAQLKRLQTLWGIHWDVKLEAAAAPAGMGSSFSRLARLGWIAGIVGRQIESAKELTRSEAITVLDALAKLVPAHLLTKRRRPDRRTARSYGRAGRKGVKPDATIDLVDAPTLELLMRLRDKLEMTQERFESFHRLRLHISVIRTQADANKIKWALQAMIKRANKRAPGASASGEKSADVLEEVAAT